MASPVRVLVMRRTFQLLPNGRAVEFVAFYLRLTDRLDHWGAVIRRATEASR